MITAVITSAARYRAILPATGRLRLGLFQYDAAGLLEVDGKENSLSAGYHGHIGRVNTAWPIPGREVRNGKKTIACVIQCFHPSGGRVEQLSHDYRQNGKTSQQASVSGTLLEDRN